jgi:lambda repressor-like predicted transcriptional regulator
VRDRERGEGGDVVGGLMQHGLDLGELAAEHAGDDIELVGDLGGPGWAKMVRIVAATISAEPRGTWARTLRRNCTQHRCQDTPLSACGGQLKTVRLWEPAGCGAGNLQQSGR